MRSNDLQTGIEIAIIGMAGYFPKSKNMDELWLNLVDKKDIIAHFTEEELIEIGISKELINKPEYIKAKAVLENADTFDAEFFGYSKNDARMLNPQIRKLLECSFEALENAGYNPHDYNRKIGIYAGASSDYKWKQFAELNSSNEDNGFAMELLKDKDFLTTHIGYKMNFRGPCINLQTGCSTSLVAVHMASRALLTGDCDMALAGGVSISTPVKHGYLYQEGMIFSSDGKCKPFDANSDGTIEGSGCGIVVLKRLKDAIKDRDTIHGIIKGSAVNNDGALKVGYTAPSTKGVSEAMKAAHSVSRVKSESIKYIEAHGTGTSLGDMIEVEALKSVYNTDEKSFLGSIKSNIGHLDAAAGIAGLIKNVLILKNRAIPPTMNFKQPNPKLNLDKSSLVVNNQLVWLPKSGSINVAVNSMGIGGNNAYVIMENWEEEINEISKIKLKIFITSAMTEEALEELALRYVQFVEKNEDVNLNDLAYTAKVGRKLHKCQLGFVFSDLVEFKEKLKSHLVRFERKTNSNKTIVKLSRLNDIEILINLYEENFAYREIVCKNLKKLKGSSDLGVDHSASIGENFVLKKFVLQYSILEFIEYVGVRIDGVEGQGIGEVASHYYLEKKELEETYSKLIEEILIKDTEKVKNEREQDKLNVYEYLLQQWKNGAEIDWQKFYYGSENKRIPLPTYPFKKERYPLSIPSDLVFKSKKEYNLIKNPNVDEWFYAPVWTRQQKVMQNVEKSYQCNKWLVFHDGSEIGDKFTEALKLRGQKYKVVLIGEAYEKNSEFFVMQTNNEKHYENLVDDLAKMEFVPEKIVHLWANITRNKELDLTEGVFKKAQELTINSYIQLIKELAKRHANSKLELAVITHNCQEVIGGDMYFPEYSTIQPFCVTLTQEYTNINYKIIDIAEEATKCSDVYKDIYNEISEPLKNELIGYRGLYRWKAEYKNVAIANSSSTLIKSDGAYLIFGGLGNIGLLLAEKLYSENNQANIILASKSFFPEESMWDYWLENSKNKKLVKRIKKVKELKSCGCKLFVYTADISKVCEVEKLVHEVEDKIAVIKGVIHSAGVVGEDAFGYLEGIDESFCEKQFNPKVYGTIVLEKVFGERKLDFIILISSLASVLGGIGQGVYSAVNGFMDSYASYMNNFSKSRWLSIGLETWLTDDIKHKKSIVNLEKYKMSIKEGLEAFNRVSLNMEYPYIVMSSADLSSRMKVWDHSLMVDENETEYSMWQKSPELLQAALLKIWRDFLGEYVNVNHNFFELGGNSLKAIQLVSRINKALNIRLKLIEFFNNASVEELANIIMKGYRTNSASGINLKKAKTSSYYPTTYVQKMMTTKENNLYSDRFNLGVMLHVSGELDVFKLEKSFKKLIDRHEVLRTQFEIRDDDLVQIVNEEVEFRINYYDAESNISARKEQFVKPFDISKPPLMRVEVLRINEVNYEIFIDMHHIIFDETALNVFFKELWMYYYDVKPEPLKYQYKDFAVWQHDALMSKALEKNKVFWLQRLKSIEPFELCGDLEASGTKYSIIKHKLNASEIMEFCVNNNVTKLSFVLAIFSLALKNMEPSKDVNFGLRITNRFNDELYNLMGCFLEKVILRFNIDKSNSLKEYIISCQSLLFETLENGVYPIEKLKIDGLIEDKDYTPILVNYMDIDKGSEDTFKQKLNITTDSLRMNVNSKYKMNLRIFDDGNSIILDMKYQSSLYSEDKMKDLYEECDGFIRKVISEEERLIGGVG